jgi:hypothetical protein
MTGEFSQEEFGRLYAVMIHKKAKMEERKEGLIHDLNHILTLSHTATRYAAIIRLAAHSLTHPLLSW